eukprot:1558327-Prymnesium_polylepis.1
MSTVSAECRGCPDFIDHRACHDCRDCRDCLPECAPTAGQAFGTHLRRQHGAQVGRGANGA